MLIRLIFCVTGFLSCHNIFAQADSGSVTLTVLNTNKQPLSAATVSLIEAGVNGQTNMGGEFRQAGLLTGTYTLVIGHTGYLAITRSITIQAGSNKFGFTLQIDTTTLEGVTVTGYTPAQAVRLIAYHATAVDAKQYHNTTTDIGTVLNRVSGARLREKGGVGSDYDFSLNGFSGKRIKFFIDGIPVEQIGSSFQINAIPVNFAERIEIYKGVVPVWLGADALGGAVNIVTDQKMRNFADVSYAYGSFNTHRSYINTGYTAKNGFALRLNAFQNYSDNNYKVTLDAADIRTGRYIRDTTIRRFHDQYHNETAIAQIGFVGTTWADEALWGITVGKYYKEIQTGATQDQAFGAWHEKGNILTPSFKYRKKDFLVQGLSVSINANYNLGTISNIDTVHARFGWLNDSITYRGKGGEYWYSFYKYKNNNANVSATGAYTINEHHQLALNNTYTRFNRKGKNIASPSAADDIPQANNKNIVGLSYQYQLPQKWDLSVFGKYFAQHSHTELIDINYARDPDTLYINRTVKKAAVGHGIATGYFITPQLQVKASYEKTVRLPDSEELFGDVVYRDKNWDLRPEKSNNINAGVQLTLPVKEDRIQFNIAGTYRKVSDFIYETFNALENKIISQNLLKVSSAGMEAEIRYTYRDIFVIGGNATYQDIRDKHPHRTDFITDPPLPNPTFNERIPNIPYLYTNADALLLLKNVLQNEDRLSVGYNFLYVHAFYLYWAIDGAPETKRTIPDQFSHDLHMVYTLKNGRYNIGVECRNIADAKLYDNFSLQKPSRSFTVKLRYFFNNKHAKSIQK